MHDPSIRNPAYQSLTDQQLAEIDALCDRFDQELLNGEAPRIETFLTEAPKAARDGLLAELLAMELEYRTQQGDVPQRDEYAVRFPDQQNVITDVFCAAQPTLSPTVSIPANVPPVLANFRLIKELGRGGMGVVWLAEQDKPVRRRVALKLIKAELTSQEVIARFDVETQALAMMDHPNIARVLDAGTTSDGRPYFVMELVDGIPVNQYCDDNRLSVDERLKLFVSVCKAVQHAHQKGIVHRDLKPSNVLVTIIDGEAVPKVIDFGLAKALEQNLLTDKSMQTEFGKVVGTVQYMSPEQAELGGPDAEDIDTRTDVYSLGVILYELLTGSTPVEKETLQQNALLRILQIIREKDPPRPSNRLSSSGNELNSAVSSLRGLHPARLRQLLRGELDWVVMKALEKDRARRYQTANDLAQDLANYLTGHAVTARPPSTWYQLQKFARRNRGLVSAALAMAALLVAGIVGTSYEMIRANQNARFADNKAREANEERKKARTSEQRALVEKNKAEINEQRAVTAEGLATAEAQHARDAEAVANFQLAVARYEAHRAVEARGLLHQIPQEYRDNFEWHFCKRRFQGSDVTCYGHTREVFAVAFAPDGNRVVSGADGGTICIWDAVTGQTVGTLDGHQGRVSSLAFSPEGDRIASAGDGGAVVLHDTESGKIVSTIVGHTARINCVVFSPAGDRIATASEDETVKVRDADSGDEIITFAGHTAAVRSVAFSPDGRQIASAGVDRLIRIWDAHSGAPITELAEHGIEVQCVAFSPDGRRLIAGSYDYVSLWNAHSWQYIAKTGIHNGMVRCVAFSPDGSQFATAGDDAKIRLWESHSGAMIKTLSGHAGWVRGVAFSPDGARLVSGSQDRTVRIWDSSNKDRTVRTGNSFGDNAITYLGHPGQVVSAVFSPDGTKLASCGSYGIIILRNAQTGELLSTMKGHVGAVSKVSFSPDGAQLVSAGDDGTVRLWNTHTGEEVTVLKGHSGWVRGVAFSPDGTRIASSGRDGTIKLWDARTFEETAKLTGHRGDVYCVAFSPDGSCVASGSLDQTVKLWHADTGEEIRTFRGHTGRVRSVAFDSRGERFVSGGYDPKVRVWDVDSGDQIATSAVRSGAAFGVAFSPDDKRIIVGHGDSDANLFDASSGQEIMPLYLGNAGASSVNFSPDGNRLAITASGIARVRVFDAQRDHETNYLGKHADTITNLTFSPDGTRIYSESNNERLVWDFATRSTISNGKWEPPAETTQTSPDGRWFVTTESNNIVLVDLELKNTRAEKAYRRSKSRFDPFWHQEQAEVAKATENWYAAVFHYAWLLKHDPESMAFYVGLHSCYGKLTTRDSDSLEARSRLVDLTGRHPGTFFEQKKRSGATFVKEQPAAGIGVNGSSASAPDGQALYFDSVSYAELGNPSFYKGRFTVEGWTKPRVPEPRSSNVYLPPYAIFANTRGSTNTALAAEVYSNGHFRLIYRNSPGGAGGMDLFSQTNMLDGKWHHFAVVKDHDDMLRLYIDGSLEASSDQRVPGFAEMPDRLILGMNHEKAPRYFSGVMDEFRFWSVARTRDQILADMNSPLDPNSPGLVAYYDFNGNGETAEFDNGLDSTVYLAPVAKRSLKLPCGTK